jgi:hypothetical protein
MHVAGWRSKFAPTVRNPYQEDAAHEAYRAIKQVFMKWVVFEMVSIDPELQ